MKKQIIKEIEINHFNVSISKSIIRITACGFLANGFLLLAGVLFAVAELLGIVEELV
jgi:hypothetical protein